MNFEEQLSSKITSRTARVGVVGLGYVGLPLAVEFAKTGFSVVGIDVQQSKVDAINKGESYIQDIPTSVLEPLVLLFGGGQRTADEDALGEGQHTETLFEHLRSISAGATTIAGRGRRP